MAKKKKKEYSGTGIAFTGGLIGGSSRLLMRNATITDVDTAGLAKRNRMFKNKGFADNFRRGMIGRKLPVSTKLSRGVGLAGTAVGLYGIGKAFSNKNDSGFSALIGEGAGRVAGVVGSVLALKGLGKVGKIAKAARKAKAARAPKGIAGKKDVTPRKKGNYVFRRIRGRIIPIRRRSA